MSHTPVDYAAPGNSESNAATRILVFSLISQQLLKRILIQRDSTSNVLQVQPRLKMTGMTISLNTYMKPLLTTQTPNTAVLLPFIQSTVNSVTTTEQQLNIITNLI